MYKLIRILGYLGIVPPKRYRKLMFEKALEDYCESTLKHRGYLCLYFSRNFNQSFKKMPEVQKTISLWLQKNSGSYDPEFKHSTNINHGAINHIGKSCSFSWFNGKEDRIEFLKLVLDTQF